LAKRPEDRPATAEALAAALMDVQAESAWTSHDAVDWWERDGTAAGR
jgi:hypothetical protein